MTISGHFDGARRRRGFTLLEVVLALMVMAALTAALTPSISEMVNRGRVEAEKRSLETIAGVITASFENTDLTNLNVAALPGTIGPADTATAFSTSTQAYTSTAASSWFAKVAKLQGITPLIGPAPTAANQPALASIAFNPLANPRLLFAGPNEAGQQRFLLLSLMAQGNQLTVPYDGTAAWFNAVWNNDWESRTAAIPGYWSGLLTPAQVVAWNQGTGGMTSVWRLCVRRIVLPKYTVTVNDNHATNAGFLSYDDIPDAFTAGPNSGASVTPEILGGRLITVNQGTAWPGTQALQFRIHENATVTIQ